MRAWPVLIAVALLPLLCREHAGSDDFDPYKQPRLFAVRDTNAARYAIEETRTALGVGRVLPALRDAQRVLDHMADDFYLVASESQPASVVWRSAAEEVRSILAELTPDQRAAYEQMIEPRAAPLLQEAVSQRDIASLEEVVRRFGASRLGVEAGRVLAELAYERGDAREAARYAQEALRYAPDDAGLWLRLIDALAEAGDRAALMRLEPPPDLTAETSVGPAPIAPRLRAAVAAVSADVDEQDWPMWGGAPSRQRRPQHPPPLPKELRWREPTDFVERSRDQSGRFLRQEGDEQLEFAAKLTTFRPSHAAVADRTVFVSDGRSVRAYDLYSGRDLWRFDANAFGGEKTPPFPMYPPGRYGEGRTSLERAFSPVVAGDLVIATVEEVQPYYADRLQRIEISMYLPRRVLVALDRRTGALRWWMGAEGMDRLTLSKMSIVAPAVVAEGMVLALASAYHGSHNVSFVAFDLATGALRWKRMLGTGQQELNLFGIPVKELAASPVTVYDGTAYVSTGLGFVAAVDIRRGVVRWLASYQIMPILPVQYWYKAPLRLPRIAPSPPVAYGDLLVVAPTDGMHLHAYDRRTGALRWRWRYGTRGMPYGVVGHFLGVVDDGKRPVALITDSELRAIAIESDDAVSAGDLAWRAPALEAGVIGQGAVAGDEVIVPTRDGLNRFSLAGKEGKFLGMVAWPEGAEPGNVLPLERVLLVTSRQAVQWFYDWADLERDVARRRRERPDDPSILIEAAELYLRAGGEMERARNAFAEALRVAERARPEFVPRAQRGLYLSWLGEGDRLQAVPESALEAYRRALQSARSPRERVDVRIRIHNLVTSEGEAASRIRIENLEAMIAEAGGTAAVFEPGEDPMPARAAGLLLLAHEHEVARRPARAVDVLQQLLREEGDALIQDETAHVRGRRAIRAILDQWGPEPYAEHERKAKELLAAAARTDDGALLERVIDEYPNATTLPEALLERGRRLLAAGEPAEALPTLRRVFADYPNRHAVAVPALALLARAYRTVEALGGARAALAELAAAYEDVELELDGRRWRVGDYVASERIALPASLEPSGNPIPLQPPLSEVHFEYADEDAMARPLDIVADERGRDGRPVLPPLAVMVQGRELVAIDMLAGQIGWRAVLSNIAQRGAYADGRLVLYTPPTLHCLAARDGAELWTRESPGIIRELRVWRGVLYALLQDPRGLAGRSRLVAVDVYSGRELWAQNLGTDNHRRLRCWEDRVLVERERWGSGRATATLLVFGAFDGQLRSSTPVPTAYGAPAVIAEGMLITVSRPDPTRASRLTAQHLASPDRRWVRPLPERQSVTALIADGPRVVVMRGDGMVETYRARDGEPDGRMRIYVGEGSHVRPALTSAVLLDDDTITFLPTPGRSTTRPVRPTLMSFERRTGKLLWEQPYDVGIQLTSADVFGYDRVICTVNAYRESFEQKLVVRLIDRASGDVLQQIQPEALSGATRPPSASVGYGTLVIFVKAGASILRKR